MIHPRSDLSEPQTTPQILRCIALRGYTARVEGGGLRIRGPQRLAGPLPASIETRRDELIGFLDGRADGEWPPGSGLREAQRVLGCGLASALYAVEAEGAA